MKLMKSCIGIGLLVIGVGCESPVTVFTTSTTIPGKKLNGNVSIDVVHYISPQNFIQKDKTISVQVKDGDKAASLESTLYKTYIEEYLSFWGMTIAKEDSPSDYLLLFDYGIDSGKSVTSSYPVYLPGQFYSSTSRTTSNAMASYYGTRSYGSAYGTGTATTTQSGVTPGSTGVGTTTSEVYKRFFNFGIYTDLTADKPQKIYEVYSASKGSSDTFNKVAAEIIDATFYEFPSLKPGVTKEIVR